VESTNDDGSQYGSYGDASGEDAQSVAIPPTLVNGAHPKRPTKNLVMANMEDSVDADCEEHLGHFVKLFPSICFRRYIIARTLIAWVTPTLVFVSIMFDLRRLFSLHIASQVGADTRKVKMNGKPLSWWCHCTNTKFFTGRREPKQNRGDPMIGASGKTSDASER
jgi:hypothetical protein